MDYKIKKGDTLSAIAKKFGTTVSALAKANNIKNVNLIYAGKTLTIPGSTAPAQPTLPASPPVYEAPVVTIMPVVPKPPTATQLGVVKTPGRDVTNISDLISGFESSQIGKIAFEQFSAIELAQIEKSDTIDGARQDYSIISNLSDIRKRYNSTKELSIMDKLAPMDGVFGIDLNSKIPDDSYIEVNNLNSEYVYLDINSDPVSVKKGNVYIDTNGDLILEFNNIRDNELIQVQIDQNGTIYEVTK